MNHQTLAKIRQDFNGTLLSALRNVLFCEANLQIIGAHHEAIAAELIAQFNPQAQDKYAERRGNAQITKWDHLYLADDETAHAMYDAMGAALAEKGFSPTKPGNCPFLEAKNLLLVAQKVLIGAMTPYTGIEENQLIRLAHFEEYLKLITGLLTKMATEQRIELNITKF